MEESDERMDWNEGMGQKGRVGMGKGGMKELKLEKGKSHLIKGVFKYGVSGDTDLDMLVESIRLREERERDSQRSYRRFGSLTAQRFLKWPTFHRNPLS